MGKLRFDFGFVVVRGYWEFLDMYLIDGCCS